MKEQLEKLRQTALAEIEKAVVLEHLEKLRQTYLGKKGELTIILKGLGGVEPEIRKEVGAIANKIKTEIAEGIESGKSRIIEHSSLIDYELDITRPGNKLMTGGLHPITKMCEDLNYAFRSLGFRQFSDSEINSEEFAFDHLNFPEDHPAREAMDTYWIAGTEKERGANRLALRPHLTGASIKYLREHGAPAAFVYPGRVYRNESTDAGHDKAFFQYEALIVDKDFSFASGKLLIETILERVFGKKVETRMRAGFFPFVEPGFEIDMKCTVCAGDGCKLCKEVGWLEVMPGGSPHPNVLRAAGLDPKEWSGFYIDIGLDRLVMMRYGVEDVRNFHSADLRFLKQFK